MSRPAVFAGFGFLAIFASIAMGQAVPRNLLNVPSHFDLEKSTQQVKQGATVTCTVTLKDARDQAVVSAKALSLEVSTPDGTKTVTLPAGKSSVTFTWKASSVGVAQVLVRSGNLRPASGLVLVEPSVLPKLVRTELPRKTQVQPRPKFPASIIPNLGAVLSGGIKAEKPATVSLPPPAPPPPAVTESATKLKLFVTPMPIHGNPVDRRWEAVVSVAAMDAQGSLVPVSEDVHIHFTVNTGSISPTDIVLPAGQFSDFEKPAVLTADRTGKGTLTVDSTLGPAGPVDVDFVEPPPTQLRVDLAAPVLAGTGSSSTTVTVCALDASGSITSPDQDVAVTLTPSTGQLLPPSATIQKGTPCAPSGVWTASSGAASIAVEASGLATDTKSITFPSFPWILIVYAALGGLVGALARSWSGLFSARGWAHALSSVALGIILGFIFFLFARFGAIVLPAWVPVALDKLPVNNGAGSFLIGFLGGLIGKQFWKLGKGKK